MPPVSPKRITLFIVEDSAIFRDRLKRFLADHEWVDVVGEAEDVAGTLAALETLEPEVMLLDLRLAGGGSGYSLLEMLKPRFRNIKVVVLTAQASAEVRQRCGSRGAEAVVAKADTDTQLMAVLQQVVGAGLRHTGGDPV